jgi:hypothetical protein
VQAPLARFGDTAANAGTLALLDDVAVTRDLPVWLKTGAFALFCAFAMPCSARLCTAYRVSRCTSAHCALLPPGAASVAAGGFRILLMPIDACKTVLQVEGKDGLALLRNKMAASGPRVLYAGGLGAASATLVGHFPW